MNVPYRAFRFDWLIAPNEPSATLFPEDGDVEWLPYPIPVDLGEGGFQKVEPAMNMSVFWWMHRFTPAAMGRLIPLAAVEVAFPELTFMVQALLGGRILHRESRPKTEVLFSPGVDLFRLSDQLKLVPVLDGSQSSEMTCLTVGITMLGHLVGETTADQLLTALGLSDCPQVVVRPIPLHVSAHLHGAIGSSLVGTARRLHCQARMLDYLGDLIDVVLAPTKLAYTAGASKERSVQVSEYLLATTELAQQFGCSTKRLNDEFQDAYGVSLYTFITAHRLEEAHAAITETDVPLKRLAERLGYAHVSNFTIAFKKKFGYPPGHLRKR